MNDAWISGQVRDTEMQCSFLNFVWQEKELVEDTVQCVHERNVAEGDNCSGSKEVCFELAHVLHLQGRCVIALPFNLQQLYT